MPACRPFLPFLLLVLVALSGCDAAAPEAGDYARAGARATAPLAEPEALAPPRFLAEPAPEWTALFERTSGWLSADGLYSTPLSGVDAPGAAAHTTTLFHFSDTLIGEVVGGTVQPGATLVNNTLAWFDGATPDPDATRFHYATDGQGRPRATFVPTTPNARAGDLYWLNDAFVNQARGHATYLFGMHLRPEAGQPFGLRDLGRNLIVIPAGSRPPFADQRQLNTPLYVPPTGGRGAFEFGNGVFVNSAEAGAPRPDGYVYVYGVETVTRHGVTFNKRLLVARVRPEAIEDAGAWRFWDGAGWVPEITAAAPVSQRVSNELSVTPWGDRYLLVFQLDTIGASVAVRVGESPVGPFGPYREVFDCPEADLDPDFFCYNAKAHPHLTGPDELLITYNVNSWDYLGDLHKAHTLHPRFIRLRLAD